jgi:sulfotransferase family protein
MTLRVVGAGLGRTGTHSLKLALEQLLGAPCYHMAEVFGHPEHVPLWDQATRGVMPDWDALFDGYAAAVDWPMAAFWREIADAYPDALILLSVRDADSWWESANATIFQATQRMSADPSMREWHEMVLRLFQRLGADISDEAAIKAAYLRHNDEVRRTAPKDRLLEWQPADGWQPICDALGVAVPDEPFPLTNTTEEFRARFADLEAT